MNEEERKEEQGAQGIGSVSGPDADATPGPQRDDVGHKALSDALNVSFRFLKIGMLILLVVYLMQGWFYVSSGQIAIKKSFGRPVESRLGGGRGVGYVLDSESGWHFAWPWQEIVWLSLEEQTLDLDTEFSRGGRAAETGRQVQSGGRGLSVHDDNYLITGDVNLIHMAMRARYRIRRDPEGAFDYAFAFESPEEVLRRMVIKAAHEVVSNWEVLEVRRRRRSVEDMPTVDLFDEIERRVRGHIRAFEEENGFSIGIDPDRVAIESIGDPDVSEEVREYFDAALAAESDRDARILRARREARRILAEAEGARADIIGRAQAHKTRLVSATAADADMMENLLPIYNDPDSPASATILREWHYGRMIDELLGMAEGAFVLHGESEVSGRELWLELSP